MSAIAGLVPNQIPAPPVGQLRYGLFSVANITELSGMDAGRLWGAGFSFVTDHCGGANAYDDTCVSQPVKPFVEGADLMEASPFRVIAKKHCGTVGRTPEEMEAGVRQQLLAGEQRVVENVVWNGNGLGTNEPSLAASSATVVTPSDAGAGAAIAALENAAYQVFGYRGVIHVNQQAYAALAYSNLLVADGPTWRTPLGTALSFGAGYDITGPEEVAPETGFVWAFMTSEIFVRRTSIIVPDVLQTMDRINNQWEVLAERAYAFTWDCPETFAVQVPVAAPGTTLVPAVP